MAEAFTVPLIPTIDTPETTSQGGVYWLRYAIDGQLAVYKRLYIAANVYGCIGAVYKDSSLQGSYGVAVAGPVSFNYRVVNCSDSGAYDYTYPKVPATGVSYNLAPYGATTAYQVNHSGATPAGFDVTSPYGIFATRDRAVAAVTAKQAETSIKYRLTNCTAPNAPMYAAPGQTVAVQLVIASGFQIMSPDDVYVENNGEKIPSSFVNNTITFVMP